MKTAGGEHEEAAGLRFLAKNIGVLTISNFASKILTFFLVPLYTSALSTAEFGTFDLINTTVNLLVPVLTLNIAEGVIRFALDKDADQQAVFTVGVRYTLIGTAIVTVLLLLARGLGIFPEITEWWPMFLAMYVCYAFAVIVSNEVRGLDKMREIAVAGVIGSVGTIALNIILLLPLHMGLLGYFIATVGGSLAQTGYLTVTAKLWRYVKPSAPVHDFRLSMRKYSTPMMANSVAWWVNNVADRYVVTAFCGVAENGIYAVATKIPSILDVVQIIFNQAWILSAVHEFDPEDKDGFYRKTYCMYGFVMVGACSALILLDRPLARFLYADDFFAAWRFVPFLLLSIVFGALSGHIGGVFAAVKDPHPYATSTAIGACVNIAINLVIVPLMGPLGAAIATAISYWVVWVIRRHKMMQLIHVDLRLTRDYASYAVLVAQSIVLLVLPADTAAVYLIELALLVLELVLYRSEALTLLRALKQFIGR